MKKDSMSRLLCLLLIIIHQQAYGGPVISNRIVGGMDSQEGEWPWQISLKYDSNFFCGGSLITDIWVLTAAHCFISMNVSEYTVYLGAYRLSDLQNTELRGIKSIILHPDFIYQGSSGDIALIELEEPIIFTPFILPVCLPFQDVELTTGTMCWVTGWGNIQEEKPLGDPETLQKAEVGLIDRTSCEAMYRTSLGYRPTIHLIQEDMICAGFKQGTIDACQGDSGGPLVCSINNTWMQFGIVSWGLGCAQPNKPGVYTKVQNYKTWIKEFVPTVMFCEGEASIATTSAGLLFTDLSQSVSIRSDLDGAFMGNFSMANETVLDLDLQKTLLDRSHTQTWSMVTMALSLLFLCCSLLL